MKIFKKSGKYGVREGFKVIVEPTYSSTREMVENDPFFNKKQIDHEQNKNANEQEKE